MVNILHNLGLLIRLYIFLRQKSCPFSDIEKFIPRSARVLDLGCGVGIFSGLLKSDFREVTGIDWNIDRIKIAKKIYGDGIKFVAKDIFQSDFKGYDCVVLIDVLYLLSDDKASKLLSKLNSSLDDNSVLLILEKDRKPFVKYCFLVAQEFFTTVVFNFNKSKSMRIRNICEMKRTLENHGFLASPYNLHKGFCYPHVLYVCRKNNAHKYG